MSEYFAASSKWMMPADLMVFIFQRHGEGGRVLITINSKNKGLTENTFNQAVEYLYRTPIDESAWWLFFDSFCKLLVCVGGQFLTLDPTGETAFSIVSKSLEQNGHQSIPCWFSENLRPILKNRRNKQLLFHYDFLENPALNRSFYNETGIRHITAYRIPGPSSTLSIMAWFRRGDQPPMGKAELYWLRRLLPDLDRLNRLHVEMIRLKQILDWHNRVLDCLDYPILLVNESGVIHFHNQSAELWQGKNDSFCFQNQRLTGRNKGSQSILDKLLRSIDRQKSTTHAFGFRDGSKPYQMMAVPLTLTDSAGQKTSQTLCLLTVGDPQANPCLTIESLRAMFGFSLAEARVTIGLATGKLLEEIAIEGGVSINTVRSQLRQALGKTGSCRQIELLRTITALPRLKI